MLWGFRLGKECRSTMIKAPNLARNAAFWVGTFVTAHVCVWTLYGVLHQSGPLHPDMIEAWLWGQEYQFGYYKHPPLWAWLAGAWFEIFPRSNWAFYLLSSLTSGLGLVGVWKLYGVYARPEHRFAGLLLLVTSPCYTLLALRFNANSILLLVWPWVAYAFALAMERPGVRNGLFFGACAAAAMLSKYYSAVLLASCLAASFAHPQWRRFYRSPAPYVALAGFLVLMAPHVIWLVNNDFPTLAYAETRTHFTDESVGFGFVSFMLSVLLFNALIVLLIYTARDRGHPKRGDVLDATLARFVAILALGPYALSLVVAAAFHVRLSTNFAIPIYFLVPLVLLQALRPDPRRLIRRTILVGAAIYALAMPIALISPYAMGLLGKELSIVPAVEISELAHAAWVDTTGAPLATVAGSEPYAMVAAFYSGDRTREFTGFNPGFAPWVTPSTLASGGLLTICLRNDALCNRRADSYSTGESKTVAITVRRKAPFASKRSTSFLVHIQPPHAPEHFR
jgi:4-amino-4-deoxy-L-arabinose transferase-like glycosyltransferase